VCRAIDYIQKNNIEHIDFVKIDTEGHELSVLQGFGEMLRIVDTIQFEYGGTFIDTGVRLQDVIDYLKKQGYTRFCYLAPEGMFHINDFEDHYRYCNIVCLRN
jgi:hypothetical protein